MLHIYCQKNDKPTLLQDIIENRKRSILTKLNEPNTGNLAYLFSTKEALDIIAKQPSTTLPSHYFLIEKLAHQLFGCLLACWTELEIYRTIQRSLNSDKRCSLQTHKNQSSTLINGQYHYEIVTDISTDNRLFHTEFSQHPLFLSDAIVLINIATFIKKHKWYEMLNILDLSSKGEHFILYQFNENSPYPTIISSALIEPYQDKKNWLFFDDFFQSNQWKNETSINALRNIFPVFKEKLGCHPNNNFPMSSIAIEDSIYASIPNKADACGVIRFTVNGPSSKMNYYMYLAQKGLANALYQSGRHYIFSIIEQPAMVLFYQAMNQTNRNCSPFLFTSSQDINKSGLITYKGICFTKHTSNVFNQYDFKFYNVKIIQRRRQQQQQQQQQQ